VHPDSYPYSYDSGPGKTHNRFYIHDESGNIISWHNSEEMAKLATEHLNTTTSHFKETQRNERYEQGYEDAKHNRSASSDNADYMMGYEDALGDSAFPFEPGELIGVNAANILPYVGEGVRITFVGDPYSKGPKDCYYDPDGEVAAANPGRAQSYVWCSRPNYASDRKGLWEPTEWHNQS
jgi:hypothetical protein